jgi:tetratricopeptide (TPR) repeat protein
MRFTERWFVAALLLASAARVLAGPDAELSDLGGRIDYGFYQDEPRAIGVAMSVLERLGDSPDVLYYRDLGALRLAQLGDPTAVDARALRDCAERTPTAKSKTVAAEAWVLAAACAVAAGYGERRVVQVLEQARALDRDNPRIVLVEAWLAQREAGRDAATDEGVAEHWEKAVAAFDAWTPAVGAPDWGQAEALAALAAIVLTRGEMRAARDLIERALWLAPDYRVAVELRSKIR